MSFLSLWANVTICVAYITRTNGGQRNCANGKNIVLTKKIKKKKTIVLTHKKTIAFTKKDDQKKKKTIVHMREF